MKRKHRFSLPLLGMGSLMAAFAVLTLTVFALLSLQTALTEQRMAESTYRSVEHYYAADLRAEEIFARLRQGETLPQVEETNNVYRYTCPISENQTLFVELECKADQWQVLRWQAVAVMPEEAAGNQKVWEGTREEAP